MATTRKIEKKRLKPWRPPPVPGLDEAPRLKAQHARAFDAVIGKRPLDPPNRKPKP